MLACMVDTKIFSSSVFTCCMDMHGPATVCCMDNAPWSRNAQSLRAMSLHSGEVSLGGIAAVAKRSPCLAFVSEGLTGGQASLLSRVLGHGWDLVCCENKTG